MAFYFAPTIGYAVISILDKGKARSEGLAGRHPSGRAATHGHCNNSYTQATRISQWAQHGAALLTLALKWITGRYAKAYHRFIERPER